MGLKEQPFWRRLGHSRTMRRIIGITGYPGAGKSTVIDQLITAYRSQGKKVGVLAVDISSSLTGGAILGDRVRMQHHSLDDTVSTSGAWAREDTEVAWPGPRRTRSTCSMRPGLMSC